MGARVNVVPPVAAPGAPLVAPRVSAVQELRLRQDRDRVEQERLVQGHARHQEMLRREEVPWHRGA